MTYGLTAAGFITKDLQTIKAELEEDFKTKFGNDLDVSPESVTGQIIGNVSLKFAQLWELLAAVYASFNPDSASGVSLDGVCALVNVKRISSTCTEVWVILYGTEGSVIPKGHMVGQSNGMVFRLNAQTTITKNSAGDITISIPEDPTIGVVYTLQINVHSATYTAQNGDTKTIVLTSLKTQIDSSGENVTCEIANDTLRIYTTDGFTPFSVILTENMAIGLLGTPGKYIADTAGSVVAPIGSVNIVLQPTAGLDAVNNLIPGTTGLDRESDDDLRIRRRTSLFTHSYAADEAIRSRLLQEVEGVSFCKVLTNREDVVDAAGRPPHSTEVLVMGGDVADIAAKLWELFPSGISFYGNVTTTIVDSAGDTQTIKFSRPILKYIWLDIQLTLSQEETFPTGGLDSIKTNIMNWVSDNISVGTDVGWQKFFGPIYQVPGIASAVVKIAAGTSPGVAPASGEFLSQNISIAETELASFDVSQITVVAL